MDIVDFFSEDSIDLHSTRDQLSLIKKYRALDEAGRELVDSMIDKLHEQHSSKSAESSSETTAS